VNTIDQLSISMTNN